MDGQAVVISQLPKVQLEPNQPVTVSQLPSVSLAAGQQVAVTELPRVKLETGQAVRVYTTTPMLTKPVGGESMATSLLTITEGMGELIANTSRCHVLLKASSTNIDAVTLGTGWTLAAGEQLKLETTAALSFSGTDGDTIQIIEVTR